MYAGVDPLTRQEIRLRSTVKDGRLAQIELGVHTAMMSLGSSPLGLLATAVERG